MTIEEQMYDEIMHKMPHRIAELVRAIDTVHKMLEDRGYRKLSDNLDQLKKTLAQTEQESNNFYKSLYDNRDFEALLPQTYNDVIEDFIDSGYIEDRINEQADYLRNEGKAVIIDRLNYDPRKEYEAGQLDLYENFFNFSQNEDFKRFCEHYYNEEYDIEEEGTFKDNYIDENGIFDFKKFCEKTYFQSDIGDDLTETMLIDWKVNVALDNAKEEWRLWEEPTKEEQIQTQEEDIDTFINSHDDTKVNILYTNGDGNHINEINCISSDGRYTLDVSKMNLASDTSMEKLQQIAKNIIASTKAKDPIIKPEPIKQNNDFER